MSRRGILIVVSGFSGAGKGTVIKELLEKHEEYALSISMTTRKPRAGEQDGKEYFFKSKEEFERLIEQEALIEYAKYVNNYYGTPRTYVEEQLNRGKDVILEIETQGAMNIKQKYPQSVLVFLAPPCVETLRKRLEGRGTEEASVIRSRILQAQEEAGYVKHYDYLLINDQLDECVENLHNIIVNEHRKVPRNMDFITDIKNELDILEKGE